MSRCTDSIVRYCFLGALIASPPSVFAQVTSRVSVDSSEAEGNNASCCSSLSADGRYVAFSSFAGLATNDSYWGQGVFLRDRELGTTELVSVASGGTNGQSSYSPVSSGGRYVAFWSRATNLVSGDSNGVEDVFVRDRQLDTTERVSVGPGGAQANGGSGSPSISADGRRVAFDSASSDLVPGDTNGFVDVFVHGCVSVGTTYCAANSNSTGAPADISAACSRSAAAGTLTLDAVPVPNQSGVFFHGASQSQTAFGNGFLCTTGGITRGAVISAVGNLATYTYDDTDTEHSLVAFVGTTRRFQYWFRDPAGGGALFNTSNAVSIVILP